MTEIELAIKISEDTYKDIIENGFIYDEDNEEVTHGIKNGTPLPAESEDVFSKLDRCMECVLESDHRSFTNRETENGWIFDHIIEWRKMIQPYIKEE